MIQTVPLAEVCEITMGQAPKGATYNDIGDGLPLVAGAGDFGDLYPAPKKHTSAKRVRSSQPGDIILGIRASIGDKVLSDGTYCLGRGVAGLRARPGLDSRYLWHWLAHAAPGLASKGRGATFLQVSKKDVASTPIPLPPMEQQWRIAAILDAAEALRGKRRQALAKLDTLTQSIFIDMLEEESDLTDARLGDLAEVQGGLQVTPKRKENPFEVPYLRVANVHRGRLDLTTIKQIRLTRRELDRTRLNAGDLLVVEGHGDKEEIGRVAVWNGAVEPCVYQNHLIRVRCDRVRLVPRFAEAYMNSWIGRRALLRAANTTSGLNTISTSDVRAVQIPLPGMRVQEGFLALAAAVDARRERLLESAAQIENLFLSLQQRAFRGDL